MNNLDYILKKFENKADEKTKKIEQLFKIGRQAISFLVSPMGQCNFRCLYCSSYGYAHGGKNLEEEKILKFVNIILDFKNRYPHSLISIIMHGYEPLQYPFSTFKKLDELVYTAGYHELNSNYVPILLKVQTNGYLLNEEKIKFFAERKWSIGFSIDGPREVHDAFRRTRYGEPTYNVIMKNVRIFKRYYGKAPGIISVFTKKHIEIGPEGYYNWLIENGFKSADIHIPMIPLGNPYVSVFYPGMDEAIKWFTELYEIWKSDTSGITLSPFYEFIEATVLGRASGRACFLSNGCYKVIELGYDGRFRFCDRGSYTFNKTIDNITKLEDLFTDDTFRKLFMRPFILKNFHSECSNCNLFERCLGGCVAESKHNCNSRYLFDVNIWNNSHNCKFIRSMYELVSKDLKK